MTPPVRHTPSPRGHAWIPALSLALTSVAFAVPGVTFLLRPELLSVVGVEVSGPTGATELRGLYGGLELGLALFFALAAGRRPWHGPALALQVLSFFGLFLGRLYGVVVDGDPELLTAGLMTLEALGGVVGVVALRSRGGALP